MSARNKHLLTLYLWELWILWVFLVEYKYLKNYVDFSVFIINICPIGFDSYIGLAEKALCHFSLCDQQAQAAALRTVGT